MLIGVLSGSYLYAVGGIQLPYYIFGALFMLMTILIAAKIDNVPIVRHNSNSSSQRPSSDPSKHNDLSSKKQGFMYLIKNFVRIE